MNSMNFTCDVCGREVFSCTFVNGMKFCAKCYQETFGETDKDRKITDLEAKLAECEKKAYSRGHSQRDIANEIKLNALREDVANKEKRIVELKQQLAESEKSKESYRLQNEQHHLQLLQFYSRLGVEAFGADIHEKALETLMIMKEQLAEKEKEKEKSLSIKSVVRTLMKDNNLNCTFRDKTNAQIQQCGDVYNSNYGYFNFEDDYDESLNNKNDNRFDITSIDLTNQDKISFAIEQLEQLKKLCQEKFNWWENSEWEGDIYDKSDVSNAYFDIEANIDNQINELKELK